MRARGEKRTRAWEGANETNDAGDKIISTAYLTGRIVHTSARGLPFAAYSAEEKCRGGSASSELRDKRPKCRPPRSTEEEEEEENAGASRQACKPINNLWFISVRCTEGEGALGGGSSEISENISTHLRARARARSAEMTRMHISLRDANNATRRWGNGGSQTRRSSPARSQARCLFPGMDSDPCGSDSHSSNCCRDFGITGAFVHLRLAPLEGKVPASAESHVRRTSVSNARPQIASGNSACTSSRVVSSLRWRLGACAIFRRELGGGMHTRARAAEGYIQ